MRAVATHTSPVAIARVSEGRAADQRRMPRLRRAPRDVRSGAERQKESVLVGFVVMLFRVRARAGRWKLRNCESAVARNRLTVVSGADNAAH